MMTVREDPLYTQDYLDPGKRSIANAIQVFFKDGTSTEKVITEYPIGHRRRRKEGIPLLLKKFQTNLATRFPAGHTQAILEKLQDQQVLERMPVHEFMDLFRL